MAKKNNSDQVNQIDETGNRLKRIALKLLHDKRVIVGIALVFVAVLALVIFISFDDSSEHEKTVQEEPVPGVCSADLELVREGIRAVEELNTEKLDNISTRIMQLDAYNEDQNCIAVIAWNHALKSEINQARQLIEQIKNVYVEQFRNDNLSNFYSSNPDKIAEFVDFQESLIPQVDYDYE